jgi:hypothetical protein
MQRSQAVTENDSPASKRQRSSGFSNSNKTCSITSTRTTQNYPRNSPLTAIFTQKATKRKCSNGYDYIHCVPRLPHTQSWYLSLDFNTKQTTIPNKKHSRHSFSSTSPTSPDLQPSNSSAHWVLRIRSYRGKPQAALPHKAQNSAPHRGNPNAESSEKSAVADQWSYTIIADESLSELFQTKK